MERDLLEKMIQERDQKLSLLQISKHENDDIMARLQTELDSLRIRVREQDEKHRIELKILTGKKDAAEELVNLFNRDLKDNEALLEYVQLIKEATPEVKDEAYIIKLKAQLTKAIHSVDLMEHQITALRENYDKIIRSLKDEISEMIDDKCKVEVDLLNKLATLDNEKREVEKHYEERLHSGEDHVKIDQMYTNDKNNTCQNDKEGSVVELDEDEKKEDEEDEEEDENDIDAMKMEIESLIEELESVNIEKKSNEARLSFIIQQKEEDIEKLQQECEEQQEVIETLRSGMTSKPMMI